MLLIYSQAAALQYEEAERLLDVAMTAKNHADALMDRCADLVCETLLTEEPAAFKDTYEDIDW